MQRQKKGFTIMEILVVITLISILIIAVLVLLSPMKQIKKAQDSRRKHELDLLKKSLEEYYNDHGCYPKPSEICYDNPQPVCNAGSVSLANRYIRSQICHICGTATGSPVLPPYLPQLPCDPEHPKKQYLYEVQANPNNDLRCNSVVDPTSNCPTWYRIYSDMDDNDSQSRDYHCEFKGCGLAPGTRIDTGILPYPFGYGFGVSSQNTSLESYNPPICYDGHVCNVCAPQGPGEPPKSVYDCMAAPGNCIKFYTSWPACYCDNPGTGTCPN